MLIRVSNEKQSAHRKFFFVGWTPEKASGGGNQNCEFQLRLEIETRTWFSSFYSALLFLGKQSPLRFFSTLKPVWMESLFTLPGWSRLALYRFRVLETFATQVLRREAVENESHHQSHSSGVSLTSLSNVLYTTSSSSFAWFPIMHFSPFPMTQCSRMQMKQCTKRNIKWLAISALENVFVLPQWMT